MVEKGDRFGLLTVEERSLGIRLNNKPTWECICDCGNKKHVTTSHLKQGLVKSCGCLHSLSAIRHGHTEGGVRTREYNSWAGMLSRCYDPNSKIFHRYGGRGVRVCGDWLRFENFVRDMGKRPPKMSLDRIDVNGDYTPENCRWASHTEQQNNRRDNIFLEAFGKKLTLAQWEREVGINHQTLYLRVVKNKWEPEKALSTPGYKKRKLKEVVNVA